MDFDSLHLLRTKRYRNRVISFLFAAIAFGIATVYFINAQSEHKQNIWNFKNVRSIHDAEMDLKANTYYKVRWEEESYLYSLSLNGTTICFRNVAFQCDVCWNTCEKYNMTVLSNPFRIKVSHDTKFGIFLNPYNLSFFNPPKSWGNPFAVTKWSVEEVASNDTEGILLDDAGLKYKINKR